MRAAVLAVFLALPVHAQSNTASIYGSAADPQGDPIPAARITIRSTDLASTRTAIAGPDGHFALTGLVPGAYTVEARAQSLALRRPVRLTVGLGSSTELSLRLDIPAVRQAATVTARPATSEGNTVAPPINQSEPSTSTFFAGTVVTYLPNRDRDVAQFDLLTSNAHEDSGDDGISIDGQRPDALLTQIDGADANSPLLGAVRGPENRSFLLPQTAIREFQIVTSGLAATSGLSGAGLVNVATKEGSNKPHGETFYTVRPSGLTSADAFGHSLDNLQNTFGASFGGPIRKNRAFYYTGFEQDFLHAPTFAAFEPQAPGTAIPTALAALQGQIVGRDTPFAFSGRIDQILSPANTLNLELAFSRLRSTNLGDGLTRTTATQAHSGSLGGQSLFTRAGLTTLLNPVTVNQLLLAWSSDHRQFTPNSSAPEQVINGFGILGGASLGPHRFTSGQFQLADGISIAHGKRLFEFGGSFSNDPAYEQREPNLNARFDYNSLAAYLANTPRRVQQTFLTGKTRYQATVRQLGLYVNSRIDLRDRLTLTAGLRWQAQFNAQFAGIPDELRQVQPRLGLAWNPALKTVIRLSTGLYNTPTPATVFHRVVADSGLQTITADSYFDPQFTGALTAPANLTAPHAEIVRLDPNFRNPASFQAEATLDQAVSPKLTLRAGYLLANTWRLARSIDANLAPPTVNSAGNPIFLAPRPFAGAGRILVTQSTGHSSCNALTVSAISQVSRRFQLTANYTMSSTRDNDSTTNPYDPSSTLNPDNLPSERAYSNLDQRHMFNLSAIFNLPAGFKLNPLFIAHSGAPYTGLIGFDTQHDANDFNDRVLQNGLEAPRNLFRQPAFTDLDLRLVKDFTLKGEGHHLDLFLDVFNLIGASNRNFGPAQASLFGTPASPIYSAAQPLYAPGTTRIGGPREIQFTARLVAF
jgi:hypothetical protein